MTFFTRPLDSILFKKIGLFFLLTLATIVAHAVEGVLVNNSGSVTFNASSTPIIVAPNLTITFSSSSNLDEAKVNISSSYQNGADVLGVQGQTGTSGTVNGLNWSWDTSIGVLSLTGNASEATYQAALRKVTYTNSSGTPTTAQRTLTFSLGSGLQYSGNGHFYEFVQADISNPDAKSAASAKSYFGLQGYLITVTSSGESQFALSKLGGEDAWIGAKSFTEGGHVTWRWTSGPEASEDSGKGRLFWTGQVHGSAPTGVYANWIPGITPNDGANLYAYFIRQHPCGWSGCVPAKWDDLPHASSTIGTSGGYVIEYGGMPGDPSLHLADDAQIDIEVAPAASPDTYSISEDGSLNVITNNGVLANDSDANNDPLTAVLDTDVSNGVLALNANGSLTYTPTPLFSGTDSFTYHANDGTFDSNIVSVTLTVNHINHNPVAQPDSRTTSEDTPLTVTAANSILHNDTDPDVHDTLHAIKVTDPGHGSLTLNLDGSLTYTPDANYNGSDSFTYKTNDGHTDSNTVTVSIIVNAVNDAPVALPDSYSITEDTVLKFDAHLGVLRNDSDAEGNPIHALKVSDPAHGLLLLDPDGSLEYTPNSNFNGNDSFTYKAGDGKAESAVTTVLIHVSPLNDPPTAIADAYSVHEDTGLSIDRANGLLRNDIDPEHSPLTVKLLSNASHGTLHLNTDGSFNYTPSLNYNGPDSFTYKANDGQLDSSIVTVNLSIDAVNDAPVVVGDAYSVAEDTLLTVPASKGLLLNDSDVDGDSLISLLDLLPSHGTLQFNRDGTFTYQPDFNYSGSDFFTYKVYDGQLDSPTFAIVNITVNHVNKPPLGVNDSFTTQEDTTLKVDATATTGLLANDLDLDGDILTATSFTPPLHGNLHPGKHGEFIYTPDVNYNGSDSFTYVASDGHSLSSVVTVALKVNASNDAPTATDDAYSVGENGFLKVTFANGLLVNDHDVDGNHLRISRIVSTNSHGILQLDLDGSFTYKPDYGFSGIDQFTYLATDGKADSNEVTVTLTINHINHPTHPNSDAYTIAQDGILKVSTIQGLLANDLDIDGDTKLVINIPTSVSHGTLQMKLDGSFTYTPKPGYSGPDSFTYIVNDGTADSGPVLVALTVTHLNHPPLAASDAYSLAQGSVLTVAQPGLLSNDLDIDGDLLTAFIQSYPVHGSLAQKPDGGFTYTPAPGFQGIDSYTYLSNDGKEDSGVVTVTLRVNHSNHPPLAANDNFSTARDTVLQVDLSQGLLINDTDIDGDLLTANIVTQPQLGSLHALQDGSFTYTPGPGFAGLDTFTYKARDSQLESNIATVIIDVHFTNRPPVARSTQYTTLQDIALQTTAPGVLAIATDPDGNLLKALLIKAPAHGNVQLNLDGSFIYTPDPGYTGPDNFTFVANDGHSNSADTVVQLTVSANSLDGGKPPVKAIPTLSQWTQILLMLLLAGIGGYRLRTS